MGVLFDFDKMTAAVPDDKVERTLGMVEKVLQETWVPVMDVMSLLGLLVHCGQILVSGSWNTAWTVNALRAGVREGFAPANSMWRDELRWWKSLLESWPARILMVPPEWLIPSHAAHLAPFTDASRELGTRSGGAGAVFGNLAMKFEFTTDEIDLLEICDTEGMVHLLWLRELCDRCPEQLAGKRFVTWCDNKSFVGAVNKHASNSATMAFLLRILHDLQARFSFDLRIEYVKSADNIAADALSRGDMERFYEFMSSVGFDRNAIVMVPVQEALRSEWSSRMRSMRSLQKQMKAAAEGRGSGIGSSSA